jgi:branched-chain amino acid transport system substrate-binding protein
MGDLTGPVAGACGYPYYGLKAYIDNVNDQGGVDGRTIELIEKNDQYVVETALQNYTSLVQDERVIAIAGMCNSAVTAALEGQIAKDGIAVVGPPQTTSATFGDTNVYTTLASYTDQARVAVEQLSENADADARVAVLRLDVPSGDEWQSAVESGVEDAGMSYAGTITTPPAYTDATPYIVQLENMVNDGGLDAVMVHATDTQAIALFSAVARSAALADVHFYGIQAWASGNVFKQSPAEVLDRMHPVHSFTTINANAEAESLLKDADLAKYGDEPAFTQGVVNGLIIEQALRSAIDTGTLDRASFLEALSAEFDTQGLSCPIDLTTENHSDCAAPLVWDGTALGVDGDFR